MTKVRSRRLVVDASVLRAAGGIESTAEVAKACRDFLGAIKGICHHVFLTVEIDGEWTRHASLYSRTWMSAMITWNKIVRKTASPMTDLATEIRVAAPDESVARIMLKDALLIEAALGVDKIVASLDDTVGDHFARAAARINRIGTIVWVNPAHDPDQCLEWLRAGAKSERARQLKNRIPR